MAAKEITYRPEVLFSVLHPVPHFEMPVVGDMSDHVSRECKPSPGFDIVHSVCAPGDNNYVKAVVFHREPGQEWRQYIFLEGFRTESPGAARLAKRRLDSIVLPWIIERERVDRVSDRGPTRKESRAQA